MRLLHRMGFQLRADAHGVMDRIEDPALLMKQHLREAELALERRRAHLQMLEEQSRSIDEAIARIDREIARLDEDVDLALHGGKEELARFTLRQLLPLRRTRTALLERRAELEGERARCSETLDRQTKAFEELRERVRVRVAAHEAHWHGTPVQASGVADEEIEIELLRRRRAAGLAAPGLDPAEATATRGHEEDAR